MLNKLVKATVLFFVNVYYYLCVLGLAYTFTSPVLLLILIVLTLAGGVPAFVTAHFGKLVFLCTLPLFLYLVIRYTVIDYKKKKEFKLREQEANKNQNGDKNN